MRRDLITVAKAIAARELAAAWDGEGACRLHATSETLLPLSAVQWQIERPDLSRVVLDGTFLSSPRLAFYAGRLAGVLPILEAAHRAGPLPPAAVAINLGDGPVVRGMAFCSNNPADLLIPDPVFVTRSGYQQVRNYWTAIPIPWHRRLPVVFWRGGTSGRAPDEDWRKLPRIVLCEMTRTLPLFDVGISHVAQIPESAEEEIRHRGLRRAFIGEGSFNFYRYHIDMDGNTNSWPGLFIKLLSGGAVLKIASPYSFRQWYYDRLIPWENYVPVNSDFSDLIEKVEWLVANEAKAMEIGKRGYELANAMTYEAEVQSAGKVIFRALVDRAAGLGLSGVTNQ